jgi:hypothetical protein
MTFQIWQLMCQQLYGRLLTHQLPYLEGHVIFVQAGSDVATLMLWAPMAAHHIMLHLSQLSAGCQH